LEGVAEELYHCGFEGVNLTYTSDIKEALTGASYIVSSGGAARKAGMTREDLLKGNAEIAAQFGKDVRQYCPNVKHIVVIFNPADITGLITLLYSGLKPSQVSTLAALDSTRLQNELVKYFHIPASEIQNCRTYGGHGEQMADNFGRWTGSGVGSIFENVWIYRDHVKYKEAGTYKIRVAQGMRYDMLEGICDVGVKVIKTN
jgi:malate dehydrogenase